MRSIFRTISLAVMWASGSIALLADCNPSPEQRRNALGSAAQAVTIGTDTAGVIDVRTCPGVQGSVAGVLNDDTDAVQACINSNPGKHIVFPKINGGNTGAAPITDYYFTRTLYLCGQDQWLDGSGGIYNGGTVFTWGLTSGAGVNGIAITPNSSDPCSATDGGIGGTGSCACFSSTLAAQGAHISNLNLNGGTPSVDSPDAHGIKIRAGFVSVDHVLVASFGGDGINIDTSTDAAAFADTFSIRNAFLQLNQKNGMFVKGHDSSAGSVIASSAVANGGWGFNEQSFLGNTYVGLHTDSNALGSYLALGDDNRSFFYSIYAEQDQLPAQIGPSSTVFGNVGVQFDWSKHPNVVQSGGPSSPYMTMTKTLFETHPDTADSAAPPNTVSLGTNGQNDGLGAFYATNNQYPSTGSMELRRTGSGATDDAGVEPGNIDFGWWGLRAGGQIDYSDFRAYPMLFSDSVTSVGQGWAWFPKGIYIGTDSNGFSRRRISVSGTVPTGACRVGDIILNTFQGTYTNMVGWICTVASGVWNAFGEIGESDVATSAGTFQAFFPGSLSSPWTASQWTPGKTVYVTGIEAVSKGGVSCTTSPVVRTTDGGSNIGSLSISAQLGNAVTFSPPKQYTGTIYFDTQPGSCIAAPSDVNVTVKYRM